MDQQASVSVAVLVYACDVLYVFIRVPYTAQTTWQVFKCDIESTELLWRTQPGRAHQVVPATPELSRTLHQRHSARTVRSDFISPSLPAFSFPLPQAYSSLSLGFSRSHGPPYLHYNSSMTLFIASASMTWVLCYSYIAFILQRPRWWYLETRGEEAPWGVGYRGTDIGCQ